MNILKQRISKATGLVDFAPDLFNHFYPRPYSLKKNQKETTTFISGDILIKIVHCFRQEFNKHGIHTIRRI